MAEPITSAEAFAAWTKPRRDQFFETFQREQLRWLAIMKEIERRYLDELLAEALAYTPLQYRHRIEIIKQEGCSATVGCRLPR